jgi:hypothetical protein
MSNLGAQFDEVNPYDINPKDWKRHKDAESLIVYHTHTPTKSRVFSNLTGVSRWEVQGGGAHGELHDSLKDAKETITKKYEDKK